jgi:hypothetical protein
MQAKEALDKMFESVRADIIAEHFTKEHNAGNLVFVAKELDDRAHSVDATKIQMLTVDAKSVLGVFADFVQAKRAVLLNGGTREKMSPEPSGGMDETSKTGDDSEPNQAKLL